MSRFRVGQRVKKVRGSQVGMTATVIGFDVSPYTRLMGDDMRVRIDGSWTNGLDGIKPGGSEGTTVSAYWEPILDRPELSTWDAIRELGIDVHDASTRELIPGKSTERLIEA